MIVDGQSWRAADAGLRVQRSTFNIQCSSRDGHHWITVLVPWFLSRKIPRYPSLGTALHCCYPSYRLIIRLSIQAFCYKAFSPRTCSMSSSKGICFPIEPSCYCDPILPRFSIRPPMGAVDDPYCRFGASTKSRLSVLPTTSPSFCWKRHFHLV